jgi:lipoprotein-anchoring transpeptidase ErfK/SrfK
MKKNILLAALLLAIFLIPEPVFSADTGVEEATDQALATLYPTKSRAAEELEKAEGESFQEDDFFMEETRPEPVASVSAVEKKESEASSVKNEKAPLKTAPSKSVAGPKEVKAKQKTEAVSDLSAPEMEKRWDALFSKEIGSDSISYTVKSGDSLYVLARKNRTTVDFIKKINGLTSDNLYPGMKLKIHTAPFSIRVDKSKNTLVLYSNDEPVKKYSVATGKNNCTPVGKFKITDKLVDPTWFKTGAILPPGSPENGLGTRWMGFDKRSYGIHGTIEPETIGTQASEGCIRMLNKNVEELYSLVPVGSAVTIQD